MSSQLEILSKTLDKAGSELIGWRSEKWLGLLFLGIEITITCFQAEGKLLDKMQEFMMVFIPNAHKKRYIKSKPSEPICLPTFPQIIWNPRSIYKHKRLIGIN